MKYTRYIYDVLYPALFDRVSTAFPDMEFKRTSKGWISPKKIDGTLSRVGRSCKSQITNKYPQYVFEQGGDGPKSLIDFYMMKNGVDFHTSLKRLSDLCGLELPEMEGEEQYKEYKSRQEKLKSISEEMVKNLSLDEPGAKAVLSYLKDVRGYSDEFIAFAGFGFVSDSMVGKLQTLLSYRKKDGELKELPRGIGKEYTLAIPYQAGGSIRGFVFRSILPENELSNRRIPKYKDAFMSEYSTKQYYIFGLTGINVTGREEEKDIVCVEGEIDALRATFAGIPNVVAMSGGTISREALKVAKERGIRRVTLLFDTEDNVKSQKDTDKKIDRVISNIQEEGLTTFVCNLPSDGGKVDVDTYLRNHTGEELQSIIKKAYPASVYRFYKLMGSFKEIQGEREGIELKELHDLKMEVIRIANSPYTSPTDRSLIFNLFETSTTSAIKACDIQEEADLAKLANEKAIQSQETISLAAEAYQLAKDGKTEEAIELLQEKTEELKSISNESKFKDLLKVSTRAERIARFKEKPVALETSYQFTDGGEFPLPLTIPSGALTIVAAPTSHGKSTFLRNLTLDIARKCEDSKSILYFTFEECEEDVIAQLTNTYIGKRLHAISKTHPQVETLTEYFRTGETTYIGGANSEISRDEFIERELEFSDKYLDTGRIRVFNKDYDLESLIEALEYAIRHIPTKAVFIDYIQILRSKKFAKLIRTEQLKEVCISLKDFSVKHKVPVILAAQLNREAKTPLRMDNIQMAESSDIEKAANTIICIWNSQFKSTAYGERGLSKDEKGDIETLSQKGFELGKDGKVFIKLTKKRGSRGVGMYSILDFQGYSGKIVENYEPSREEPQQESRVIQELRKSLPY